MSFKLLVWLMCASLTVANLKHASFQWGCSLATQCLRGVVFQESASVQWSWGQHLVCDWGKRGRVRGLSAACACKFQILRAWWRNIHLFLLLNQFCSRFERYFFSLQIFWCTVFWSCFSCRVEQPSVFAIPLVLTLPRHCLLALCITRFNFIIHVLSTWRFPIQMGAHSFGVRCQISHPVFSVSHNYCQHCLKHILLFLQFEIFSALRKFIACIARYHVKQLTL